MYFAIPQQKNGVFNVMVTDVGNGIIDWTRLFAFHFALMHLGKMSIHLFSPS